MNDKVVVTWMDDSGGVLQTCHFNGPGDRVTTYIGEIWCMFDDTAAAKRRGRWFSKLKGEEQRTEHPTSAEAKARVEGSVDGAPL